MSQTDPTSNSGQESRPSAKRALTIAGVVLLAGIGTWFATASNREAGNPILGTASGEPRVLESSDVNTISNEIGQTIFWAGERPGTKIELSNDEIGNTHVRYLTGGAEPGDPNPAYLDIGTYPFKNGYSVISKMSQDDQLKQIKADGMVGFYDPKRPTNIYLGFADSPDFQVEVFHPESEAAIEVVRSGDIVAMP